MAQRIFGVNILFYSNQLLFPNLTLDPNWICMQAIDWTLGIIQFRALSAINPIAFLITVVFSIGTLRLRHRSLRRLTITTESVKEKVTICHCHWVL